MSKHIILSKYIGWIAAFLSLTASSLFGQIQNTAPDSLSALAYLPRAEETRAEETSSNQTVELTSELLTLKSQAFNIPSIKELLLFLSGLISISLFGFYIIVSKANSAKRQMAKEQEKLRTELQKKTEELSIQALQTLHRSNGFHEIEEEIRDLMLRDNPTKYQKILKIINANKSFDQELKFFNECFTSIHKDFFDKLNARNISLSLYEQRLCALIKMNFTNKEIARLLNIADRSVGTAKYRLKKKLELNEETDLSKFIANI